MDYATECVWQAQCYAAEQARRFSWKQCPVCGGHGEVTHGGVTRKCNRCNGTGQVQE